LQGNFGQTCKYDLVVSSQDIRLASLLAAVRSTSEYTRDDVIISKIFRVWFEVLGSKQTRFWQTFNTKCSHFTVHI